VEQYGGIRLKQCETSVLTTEKNVGVCFIEEQLDKKKMTIFKPEPRLIKEIYARSVYADSFYFHISRYDKKKIPNQILIH
jgi:hypothetical protein